MGPTNSLNITIIDDDVMLCMMVRDSLEKNFPGCNVTVFNTGEDALAKIVDSPDIVVLDYQLDSVRPEAMNGIQILTKLKERFTELPVIFMSAQDRVEVASNTIKYGAYDYIVKGETAFHKLELAVRQLSNLRTLQKSHGVQKMMNLVFWVLVGVLLVYIIYLRLH